MDINNIIGGSLNIQPGGARRVEVKVETPAPAPVQQPQAVDVQAAVVAEAHKLQKLQAAVRTVQNQFRVGDTTFAIFRDAAGHYVTRVRSLRDGTVRTFPEQSMYDFVRSQVPAPTLNTEA